MAKKLTKRQAWLWLAEKWAKPQKNFRNEMVVYIGMVVKNLHESVIGMFLDGMISKRTYASMISAIAKIRHKKVPYWPRDDAGARERAAFCRRQAKLLTRKPSKRKAVCK
jgi:hypothetical protein